jgi:hypothetical protein
MTDSQKLSAIYRMLMEQKTETWVSPGWITKLTGWKKHELYKARESGIVKTRTSPGGGYEYLVESIPVAYHKSICQCSKLTLDASIGSPSR